MFISRSTTTIRTTTPTERRRPEPRRDRVNCFTCGSLFSTDAPDCGFFNVSDVAQRKTCEAGEVCLWYSYLKAANERATIRECYSPRILLGSIDNPIDPFVDCHPLPCMFSKLFSCNDMHFFLSLSMQKSS